MDGMITTSPVYDGRMTGGRKGIPYDLSQFATAAVPVAASRVETESDDANVVERVLVAA